jgi:hypothetical protein
MADAARFMEDVLATTTTDETTTNAATNTKLPSSSWRSVQRDRSWDNEELM